MAEEARINLLLQQADRALETIDEPSSPLKDSDTAIQVAPMEHLKKTIESLELQLKAKTALCQKLEATVNKLLLCINNSNSNGSKHELSEEYFREVLQTYKAQLWFRKPIPPIVDGIYERFKARVEHEYEVEKRRTAFTMAECQNAVNQVRIEWEEAIPPPIVRLLTSDNRVFASAAERATKEGDTCEAVHYLIYLVFKMYNRAAHVLHTMKKKDAISLTSDEPMIVSKMLAAKVDEHFKGAEDATGSMKWHSNPHAALSKLVLSARKSVYYTRTLHDEESCREAITVSVSKLMSKPTLSESLELLASIIALKEYAHVKKWKLESSSIMHRDIFQYKMLEAWQSMDYKGDWSHFRTSFFRAINSLLAYALIVRSEIAEPLVKHLSSIVKPSNRKEFDACSLALLADRNVEPLFSFMGTTLATAPIPDYMSAYSWLFVYLVQVLALQFDSVTNHETILLNLIEDLRIDLKLMSALEKKDYVRAISITCSVVLGGIDPPNIPPGEEALRAKYTASAFFLCTRIGQLLNQGKKDGTKFWYDSPLPGYRLIDYGEEATLQKVRKQTHLLHLPRLENEPVDDTDFEQLELGVEETTSTTCKVASEEEEILPPLMVKKAIITKRGVADELEPPTAIRGLKIPALQQLLAEKHLSILGKKAELQQRLVETGAYTMEAPVKKRKLPGNSGHKTRRQAEAEDSDDTSTI